MKPTRRAWMVAVCLAALVGTSGCFPPVETKADEDSADTYSEADTQVPDALTPDTVEPDTYVPDTLTPDTVEPDTYVPDALTADTIEPDTYVPDTYENDTSVPDTYQPDTTPPPLDPPTGVTASTDQDSHVALAWDAVAGATGYLVERCDQADCTSDAAWEALTPDPVTDVRHVDLTADGPPEPSPPSDVQASADLTDTVEVTWSPVPTPEAARYAYRVIAVDTTQESAPSATAEGHRKDYPVVGYAIRVDGGQWKTPADPLATSWDDPTAPAPTLYPGVVTASQGTYAEFVRLTLSGAAAADGATRSYELQAITALGASAASAPASGYRVPGAVSLTWERSAGAAAADFQTLVGATGTSFDDTGAPADGTVRWYRAVAHAAGASDAATAPVAGSRQPPPGVPGGVAATSDLAGYVRVTWQPVSGALGYRVFRDGSEVTASGGITSTSFDDTGAAAPGSWSAPTNMAASTQYADRVVVGWTAPTRPLGAAASYQVQAINAAGDGPLSAGATGRRAAPALQGFEVEVTPSGGSASWYSTGSTDANWTHADPPLGHISAGTVAASQGEHRDFVALESTGATVSPGALVTYRARGRLTDGSATPTSGSASGRRGVAALEWQWQSSSSGGSGTFVDIPGATDAMFDDTEAPSDGSPSWYRVSYSATGAEPTHSQTLSGSRLALVAVDGGTLHTCARSHDGEVWCWGGGASGQLGYDVGSDSILPAHRVPGLTGVTAISAGASSNCAWTPSETLCWGAFYLGDGTDSGSTTPIAVPAHASAQAIAFGNAGIGSFFFSPFYYGCEIDATATARCWGTGLYTGTNANDPVDTPTKVKNGFTTIGWSYLGGVTQLSAVVDHACARLTTGNVWCWGDNGQGQLGGSPISSYKIAAHAGSVSNAVQVATARHATCARTGSYHVECWGEASDGKLGDDGASSGGQTPTQVVGVSTAMDLTGSADSFCVHLTSGDARCWGSNAYGELGNGSTASSSATPVTVVLPQGTVSSLASGSFHHCAIVDGDVWCWGRNESGQLGDGTTDDQDTPVRVVFP